MQEKAKTYDEGKEPLAMLPWAAIDEMSRVQAYGHAKYKDFNNYRKGMEVSRNLSCAIRHIRDYLNGHDADHESHLNPLGHAMCRIAFVLQNIAEGKAIDDRYRAIPLPSHGLTVDGRQETCAVGRRDGAGEVSASDNGLRPDTSEADSGAVPSGGKDQLDPRVLEVLNAKLEYLRNPKGLCGDQLFREWNCLFLRLTTEQKDQFRAIEQAMGHFDPR